MFWQETKHRNKYQSPDFTPKLKPSYRFKTDQVLKGHHRGSYSQQDAGKEICFLSQFVHNIKIYLLCPCDGWWRIYKVTVYSTKAMPIFMNTLTLHCQQSTKHTADFRMSTKGKILYRFLFGSVVHIITGLNKCEQFRSDKQYKKLFGAMRRSTNKNVK